MKALGIPIKILTINEEGGTFYRFTYQNSNWCKFIPSSIKITKDMNDSIKRAAENIILKLKNRK